jgi:hypothetical protein
LSESFYQIKSESIKSNERCSILACEVNYT